MNIEKVQIKPGQYVWVERRPPMDSEYWIYGRNSEWDTTITKNVLPVEWYQKLHDVNSYCTIVAASPELGLKGVPDYVNPTWEDVRRAISMARETEHDKIKSADEIIELLKNNNQ